LADVRNLSTQNDSKKRKGTLTPPSKIQNFTFSFTDCTVTQGSICRQRWDASLSLTPNTCTLDGQYQLSWSTGCGAGLDQTTCPLLTADMPTSVNFSLQSENFCAEVDVDVGLTGSVASYSDSGYSNPSSAFIVGRTAYFLVSVNSELNPSGPYDPKTAKVTFSSTSLVSVTVKQKSTTNIYYIFQNGATYVFGKNETDLKTNCVALPNSNVYQVGFSFVFSTQLASSLTSNGQVTFTIGATVRVSYVQSKKRGVEQAATDTKNTYTVDNTLSPDTTITSTGGTTTGGTTTTTTTTTGGTTTGGTTTTSGGTTTTSGGSTTTSGGSTSTSTSNTGNGVIFIASCLFLLISLLI